MSYVVTMKRGVPSQMNGVPSQMDGYGDYVGVQGFPVRDSSGRVVMTVNGLGNVLEDLYRTGSNIAQTLDPNLRNQQQPGGGAPVQQSFLSGNVAGIPMPLVLLGGAGLGFLAWKKSKKK